MEREQPKEEVGLGLYLVAPFNYGDIKVNWNFYIHNFVNYLINKGINFEIEEFIK